MTLRWDKLLPTKTTLIKNRNPTVNDAIYDYAVIWVNKLTNSAWLLKDGTIQTLPPTSGNVTVGDTSSTSIAELANSLSNLQSDMENTVKSDPSGGQYQITEIALDADKKIVVTHNNTPET